MRVLFVTNEVPFPPDNGIRIVAYNAMRLMCEAGNQLALAVLSDELDAPDERLARVSSFCETGMTWRMPLPSRHPLSIQAAALVRNEPFFVERFRSELFRKKLKRLVDEFRPDVVHFDIITMAQYRDVAPPGVGTVASINDSYALSLENALAANRFSGLHRLYRKLQYKQVRRYEATVYPRFGTVHVMSETDAGYLRKLNPNISVTVIPNGVQEGLFRLFSEARGITDRWDVLFVGKLEGDQLGCFYEFLSQGWPIVRQAYPNVELYVVGRLGSQANTAVSMAENLGGVNFKGYVKDLAEVYRGCGISVVPINKNCGLINKAIEAMAGGLAVVGFDKTFAGIPEGKPGVHFVAVTSYEQMGYAIVQLLQDKDRSIELRRAAHRLASTFYSWATRSDAYGAMYERVVKEAKPRSSQLLVDEHAS